MELQSYHFADCTAIQRYDDYIRLVVRRSLVA